MFTYKREKKGIVRSKKKQNILVFITRNNWIYVLVDVMNDVRVCVSKSVCMFAIERWIVIECISNAVERLLLDCWTNKIGLGQFVTLRNFPFLLHSFHFRVLPSRWLFISFDTIKPYHKINNIAWMEHTSHCNIDVF